ncbi:MAG: PAS domain-containing protein [Archaeoglobaceae archaeon]
MGMGACNPPGVNFNMLSILDEVLDYSSDGVFILDEDGMILYVNESMSSLLGFTKDELLGVNIKELYVSSAHSPSAGTEAILRRNKGDTIKCFEITKAFKGEEDLFYKLIWSKNSQEDQKENNGDKQSIKKMLAISGEINHLIAWERDSRRLLRKVCRSIGRLKEDLNVWIGFFDQGRIEIVESIGHYGREKLEHMANNGEILCLKAMESQNRKLGTLPIDYLCKNCSLNGDESIKKLVIPISHKDRVYGVLWIYSHSKSFTNEELEMINDLASDLALALKTVEVEKKRKEALDKMKDNLEYFEYLADRLRNPLAIMRGFVDVREDVGEEKTFKELTKQINRMNRILDNLRTKEEETFKLKQNLIR